MNTEKKLKIPYPIIVEGKYDRLLILSVVDCPTIIPTDGFSVFNSKEKKEVLSALVKKTPVIVLTDSDGAGNLIRSHLSSFLPKDKLFQVYIPQIKGKEKRKTECSAEGTLGVEGMNKDLIYSILLPYQNEDMYLKTTQNKISKTDFYIDGLSGSPNSGMRRNQLAKKLELPDNMTANALLSAVKLLCDYEEYKLLVKNLE